MRHAGGEAPDGINLLRMSQLVFGDAVLRNVEPVAEDMLNHPVGVVHRRQEASEVPSFAGTC